MSEGLVCLALSWGPGRGQGRLCGHGGQFRGTRCTELLEEAQGRAREAAVVGSPRSWAYWEPTAGDFPARTLMGAGAGALEPLRPPAPRQETSGAYPGPEKPGLGAARCSRVRCAPQTPPAFCSAAKNSRVTLPQLGPSVLATGREAAGPRRAPVSLPPLFAPGGHGGHLKRAEAELGQRADPLLRAGAGPPTCLPPPHPGAKRSSYR